jgi:PAS domain S-box-containing protein
MKLRELQLLGVVDPRLAPYATSALPAWLWSTDGLAILWANPVGARLFGAANSAALAKRTFGPADAYRRQVVQLTGRLSSSGAIRLERLRGFGGSLGSLMTCACARLDFADGRNGILVVATEPSRPTMPLVERLQLLVDGFETPIAAFSREGLLVAANEAARPLIGFHDLSEAGLDDALSDALANGRVERPIGVGAMVLQRVGSGNDIGLVALVTSSVADEPAPSPAPQAPPAVEDIDERPRRHPLRFTWRMDADTRFSLGDDEFARLIGPQSAARFGRPWQETADDFGLDAKGRVLEAIATRDTWSGIAVDWPVDGGGRLPVELSGVPIHDSERNFAGYRGFGVCRDLDGLAHLRELRRLEPLSEPPVSLAADTLPTNLQHPAAAHPPATHVVIHLPGPRASMADETSPRTDLDEAVEPPKNVVPFRSPGEPKSPALTPVEDSAFNELARQLSLQLERNESSAAEARATNEATEPSEPARELLAERATSSQAEWLQPVDAPARGEARRDRALLDLLPTGILIYRLDRLLYANPAFLARLGYESLHALEYAGGLDALYVEAGVSQTSSTSQAGTPVTISAGLEPSGPFARAEARLFTITWDGESALALMFTPTANAANEPVATAASPVPPPPATSPPVAGHANAEDLAAILDTTSEGIVMFDAAGTIYACNRAAEALFGHDGDALVRHNLVDLFAPASRQAVAEYLESIKGEAAAIAGTPGREMLGRSGKGADFPLSISMGRTRPGGPNFFAVFRGLSRDGRGEDESARARQLAEDAASAKADLLARISHEVRAPLNTIIGFAEVMIGERFGALGNARYAEYLKDIRTSGERVTAIINDLTELSRIETGKLNLAFASQNLNELVESCVSVMQPQANRERIIIRTSLAQSLPPVVADGHTLRQITMSLIGNSIHLANPAGQVIVSTALSDLGEVVLRVRDTGQGLNDNEIAAALEPPTLDKAADGSPFNLSQTKALVEANRARFHIKSAGRSGTLIEVVFARA